MIRSLKEWTLDREQRRRATTYVSALFAEPSEADVEWLSLHGTDCDTDHARWELRYARRALGLLGAQRDALDDRTELPPALAGAKPRCGIWGRTGSRARRPAREENRTLSGSELVRADDLAPGPRA